MSTRFWGLYPIVERRMNLQSLKVKLGYLCLKLKLKKEF